MDFEDSRKQSPTAAPPPGDPPVRVMVVDDSAFMRFTLSNLINATPGMRVVGSARDGQEALEALPSLNPDVITLDVEMPRVDGLTALRQIMSSNPRPVIMLSSLTVEGARETVKALTYGAFDFIAKPAARANVEAIRAELLGKIRRAARTRVAALAAGRPRTGPLPTGGAGLPKIWGAANPNPPGPKATRPLRPQDRVVVIGASTGGPRALTSVIPQLPADLPAALVIVQHMPEGFTRSLAERFDGLSALLVKEAVAGDRLEVGKALVAPGGYHLVVDQAGVVQLNQNPPVHGVRPSVDVTMLSAAQQFGANTIGVILTGMGSDGANGAALIHGSGGRVIAEDESTCVVWGMPRSVVEAGAADQVLPLPEVAAAIVAAVCGSGGRSPARGNL